MATRFSYEDGGIIVFYTSGLFGVDEFAKCQSEAESIIQKGNAKLLIIATDFLGWKNDDDWTDFSFQERNDPFIGKMAIVCEPEWRDLVSMFTLKGMRKFPIEIFTPGKEELARAWLLAD